MPELKPCPACGSTSVQLMTSYSPWFTQAFHVLCIDCQMQGPIACSQREEDAIGIQDLECLAGSTGFEAAAIAAWNTLPRALRWTHEPPKVAGFYFLKMASGTISMVYLSEQDIKDKDWHGCVGQWVSIAGPIPAPID